MWDMLKKYLADQKIIIFLYMTTWILVMSVGCLYHLENIPKLLYAFLMSSFIWLCAGGFGFYRFIQKCRRMHLLHRNLEQIGELLTDNTHLSAIEQLHQEMELRLYEEYRCLQSRTELKRSEMNDYYLMWAHQIKTPIAAMKLLLNEREDGFLLSGELFKIEQYVEMVLHYLRLESISSDMLLKEYCLADMVKQTVKKFSILFINRELSLQLGDLEGIKVVTDEKWFCFVLEQLLSNSIKYTKKGRIAIYMEEKHPKTLVLEDTGIGIRSEDLPRIFERGFTGYNGRMDKKSTGIGLYLCKKVVNQLAHGIQVVSEEGKGTKVILDLNRDTVQG